MTSWYCSSGGPFSRRELMAPQPLVRSARDATATYRNTLITDGRTHRLLRRFTPLEDAGRVALEAVGELREVLGGTREILEHVTHTLSLLKRATELHDHRARLAQRRQRLALR